MEIEDTLRLSLHGIHRSVQEDHADGNQHAGE